MLRQTFAASSQVSVVQTRPSPHRRGVPPEQAPVLSHASPVVQNAPSSQAVPTSAGLKAVVSTAALQRRHWLVGSEAPFG